MDETAVGGHPDLPLVFKISFGSDNRRVTYPRGRHCQFDSLRGTIERLFSLSASSFFIAYTDDDGDETAIKSDLDLGEAIQYFASGFDDTATSYTSATASTTASFDSSLPGGGSGGEKVTLRIQIVVEYDGPALSETGSIAESLSDLESEWGAAGGDGGSERSSQWTEGSEDWAEGPAERDRRDNVPSGTRIIIEEDWDDESIDLSHDPFLPAPASVLPATPAHPLAPEVQTSGPSYDDAGTAHPGEQVETYDVAEDDGIDARTSTPYEADPEELLHRQPSTVLLPTHAKSSADRDPRATSSPPWSSSGPQRAGASQGLRRLPSIPSSSHSAVSSASSGLENSEFGARWLQEQGEMHKKWVALPGAQPVADVKGKRRDIAASLTSDDDAASSVAEGALALERDVSGKWYYNYSAGSSRDSFGTDSDKRFSRSTATSTHSRPLMMQSSSASLLSSGSTSHPPLSHFPQDSNRPQSGLSFSTASSSSSRTTDAIPLEVLRIAAEEESGVVEPPRFAPDCAACGVRLSYMRYACVKCGESEKRDEHGNPRPAHGHHHPHPHPHHHYHHPHRSPLHLHEPRRFVSDPVQQRSHVDAAIAEIAEDEEDDGYASDGTELVGHRKHSPSTPSLTGASSSTSSLSSFGSTPGPPALQKPLPQLPASGGGPSLRRSSERGFELCASCVELHGHEHSKDFFKRRTETGGWDFAGRGEDNLGGGHAFREIVWSGHAHGGWTDVEYDGESACSICAADISRSRFKCVSCQKFDLCKQCYQRVEDIHPVHAFLSVPDRACPTEADSSCSGQTVQHPGAFCHNCLQNIVGPRFHCAICPSWDLCAACESLPFSGASGAHSPDHIMMKIPVPLGNAEVEQVSRRVRDQWLQQDSQAVAADAQSGARAAHTSLPTTFSSRETASASLAAAQRSPPPLGPPLSSGPLAPPPQHPSRSASGSSTGGGASSTTRRNDPSASDSRNSPWSLNFSRNGIFFRRSSSGNGSSPSLPPSTARISPPASSSLSAAAAQRTGHRCSCSNCGTYLSGSRYQCANCPSDPVAYNLCPACEAKSYIVHDANHAFIRIDRPVDFQIRSRSHLLPLLYSLPVGQTLDPSQPPMRADVAERLVAVRNRNDPTAYLRFLYHPSTVCDFCMIPITGCWFRCAVCPSSFDLCSDCHRSIEHDRDHVFLVLKSSVDMQVFRDCTALSAETSRPLISQRIYLPS